MPQWRHRFSEMTNKKLKINPGSVSTSAPSTHGETKTRLRFLNKKPLCLQYNLPSGRRALSKSKRKEPSLVYSFVVGAVSLMKWILETAQREVTDFLLKPVDGESVPREDLAGYRLSRTTTTTTNTSHPLSRYGQSVAAMAAARRLLNRKICSKPRLTSLFMKDFGRAQRVRGLAERQAELCYIDEGLD